MTSARKLARQRAARKRQEAQMQNLAKGAQERAQAQAQQGRAANPNDPKNQIQSISPDFQVSVTSAGAPSLRRDGGRSSGNVIRKVMGPSNRSRSSMNIRVNPPRSSSPTRVVSRTDPAQAPQQYGNANLVQQQQRQVPPELSQPQQFQSSQPEEMPQPIARPGVAQDDVTIILTTYERPAYLRRQLQALNAQTIQPKELWVWANAGEVQQDARALSSVHALVFRCNGNLGGWPRFERALHARTKYVCILDDDTIPGPQWLQTALERIRLAESDPEVGTICVAAAGEIFREDNADSSYIVGPQSPRGEEVDVDIGRGGWVFAKDLLRPFIVNPPPGDGRVGWDFHLAVNLQLQNILTVVLPYEQGNTSKWGMLEAPSTDRSLTLRLQAEAANGGQDMASRRRELYGAYRSIGWEPICVFEDEDSPEEAPPQPGEAFKGETTTP
jgi:hypothetical protein